MGNDEKFENKKQELWGKGKEVVGDAMGDDELKAQGKFDQTKAKLKQAAEEVKDAFRDDD